jgi:peptidoglycan/xylan/chitin deacetylase (PgdA/CDA1 family)
MLLVVNFHYVSAEPERGRAIFPISTKQLAAQVELLAASYELVSRDRLEAALRDETPLPERACLLTFDDGLRSQVELALPVLDRLGVPAIFFVPGLPLVEPRVLEVHKLHAVRERLDDEELAAILRESPVLAAALDEVGDAAAVAYRYDAPLAAALKYLLNLWLPPAERARLITELFERAVGGQAELSSELYASKEQVVELERRGLLGAHGYSHAALTRLAPAEIRHDLERSASVLRDLTGATPRLLAYPYGSADAVSREVAELAAEVGFAAGFTMERAVNETLEQPLLLARIDASDGPGGERARLDLAGRERYLDERAGILRR